MSDAPQKPKVEAKDLAASTAVGSASRAGASIFRQKQGAAAAKGAAAGTPDARKPARAAGSADVRTGLAVAVLVIAMLALMIALGGS